MEANEEDIKKRYHKLSALVHPDKNPDPQATVAFEFVTWAHKELKEEDRRGFYVHTFEICRAQVESKWPLATREQNPAGFEQAVDKGRVLKYGFMVNCLLFLVLCWLV
jgi:DnaJ-class molecular chaperone